MQAADTARSFINVTFPDGALPWQVIVAFMFFVSVLVGMVISKAGWYKGYAKDFPTQTSTVIAGIAGFSATLALVLARGALGMKAFDGMDWAFGASLTMSGVGGGVLIGKRFSSTEYKEAQAKVEAAKAGAAVPEGMTETAERRSPLGRKTDRPRHTEVDSVTDDGAVG